MSDFGSGAARTRARRPDAKMPKSLHQGFQDAVGAFRIFFIFPRVVRHDSDDYCHGTKDADVCQW